MMNNVGLHALSPRGKSQIIWHLSLYNARDMDLQAVLVRTIDHARSTSNEAARVDMGGRLGAG